MQAGTGKTLVGAEIAVCYLRGLVANCSRKLLACAATNMAADLLARKLAANDIRVVLLEARSKEKSCPSSAEYTLHQRVLARLKGALPAAEEPYWGELRVQYANKDRGSKTFNEAVYNTLYRRAEQEILNWAEAVCCTCISAGTKRLNMHSFDSLVLDEANLVSLPELLIPVSRGIERLVLIGDHKQKKPFITMDRTEVPFLAESQFERMLEDHPLTVLNEQARMDPAISKFVSKQVFCNFSFHIYILLLKLLLLFCCSAMTRS